jgi:hypothetical protein
VALRPRLLPGVPLSGMICVADVRQGTNSVKLGRCESNPRPRHYEEWCVPLPSSNRLSYNTRCAGKTAARHLALPRLAVFPAELAGLDLLLAGRTDGQGAPKHPPTSSG